MKSLTPILICIFLNTLFGQVPQKVPYNKNPDTPSLESLKDLNCIDAGKLTKEHVRSTSGKNIHYFYLDGQLYNGWSKEVFNGNDHYWRFIKYEEGLVNWQIGYYSNGKIDHDFHMKEGKSFGSERMWNSDGSPYIDHYYGQPGVMEGIQRRWHSNGQLAWEAHFSNGMATYEINLSPSGDTLELKAQPLKARE